jgi:hypothetical protein
MSSLKGQKALIPQPMRVDGNAVVITDKVVLGASPGLGTPVATDTLDFRLPAGFQICDLDIQIDDADTGAAFLFGVGYRAVDTSSALVASTTYFAAAGQTTAQAGGRLRCTFKPIKFEEDVYLQVVVGTGPAGIAGNPEFVMVATGNQLGPK